MHFLKSFFTIFLYLFLLLTYSFSDKVEIVSDSMEAKNIKKQVHFIGNVKINESQNWLHGDRVIVYFNENNETDKYEAIGNVKFEFRKEESFYKGSAKKVTYFPAKSQYLLEGKAVIDDMINRRHVHGNAIVFDMLTGNANVKGSAKKPVKFIFEMESKK